MRGIVVLDWFAAHLDAEVDALIKVQALECLKYF